MSYVRYIYFLPFFQKQKIKFFLQPIHAKKKLWLVRPIFLFLIFFKNYDQNGRLFLLASASMNFLERFHGQEVMIIATNIYLGTPITVWKHEANVSFKTFGANIFYQYFVVNFAFIIFHFTAFVESIFSCSQTMPKKSCGWSGLFF